MADAADDLSAPLGQTTRRRKRHFRLPFTGLQALAVMLGLFLAAFAGFAIFNDNLLGGEPIAHVALRQTAPTEDRPRRARPWVRTWHRAGCQDSSEAVPRRQAKDRHHHRRIERGAP